MKTFSYHTLIRENHLDSFGHVNNAVYLELMEEARWDLITKGGYGIREVHHQKKGPVILEVNVKFLKELRVREKIRIDTRCVNYEKVVAELEQKIWNENGDLCTQALFKFALFDLEKRRIIKPTPQWLNALGL